MPLVRAIARDAARDGYRFSAIVLGVVKGAPFHMNTSLGEGSIAMSFIMKTHVPRRTFLRSAGVTLALPLLDAVVPAKKRSGADGCTPEAALRRHLLPAPRMAPGQWEPQTVGALPDKLPYILESLEPVKNRPSCSPGCGPSRRAARGNHRFRSLGGRAYLTAIKPKKTAGADACLAVRRSTG